MYTYKNLSKLALRIANVGVVAAGKTIDSASELHHPWLERVEQEKPAPKPKKDT